MLSTRDKIWNRNFRKLKAYIDEFHHLPDKKKVENRGILNWVKYNRKKIKAGTMEPEKQRLFSELLASRHAGLDPASSSILDATSALAAVQGLESAQ